MSNRFFCRLVVIVLCLTVGLALAAKECPRCGTDNPDNARFCRNCRYEFPPPPRPPEPLLNADVTVEPGGVNISSTPTGAAVFIDGVQRGITPLRLTGIRSGDYQVELLLPGYRGYAGEVSIPQPKGSIRIITSPPGAQILIDDRSIGSAPDTGIVVSDLDLGEYLVAARLTGRLDQARMVELDEDRPTAEVRLNIPSAEGFLSVDSRPRGALVIVDGETVGRTVYGGAFRADAYRVELTMEGFRRWQEKVAIPLHDTAYVSATMVPIRERRWGFLAGGVAGVAGGVVGMLLGQAAYNEYLDARSPDYTDEEITGLRRRTVGFDWFRNIAGGIGVASLGAFFLF